MAETTETIGTTGPDGIAAAITAQHSRSQGTITVAVDATQDGTEQEQHGQQEDAAATALLGHHTDAAADVTKQSVFK